MVAEEADSASTTSLSIATAQIAIPQIAQDLPILHQWRPRNGKDGDYELFRDTLDDALVSIGIDPSAIDYQYPHMTQLRKSQPQLQEPQLSEMLAHATEEWQLQGNVIYHMVKTALLIDGVHQSEDLEDMRAFARGLTRDGRALLRWAHQWSDDSTHDAQVKIKKEMATITFRHDVTLNEFHLQSRRYWKLWCRVPHNDPAYPASFWNEFLLLLPGVPSHSHLAQLRSHLAARLMDNHPSLLDPPSVFKALERLAKALGMPQGSSYLQQGGPTLQLLDGSSETTASAHSADPVWVVRAEGDSHGATLPMREIFGTAPTDVDELKELLRQSDSSADDMDTTDVLGLFMLGPTKPPHAAADGGVGAGVQAKSAEPKLATTEIAHAALEAATARLAAMEREVADRDRTIANLRAQVLRQGSAANLGNAAPAGAPVARPPRSAILARSKQSPLSAMQNIAEGGQGAHQAAADAEAVSIFSRGGTEVEATNDKSFIDNPKLLEEATTSKSVLTHVTQLLLRLSGRGWELLQKLSAAQLVAIATVARIAVPLIVPLLKGLSQQVRYRLTSALMMLIGKVKEQMRRASPALALALIETVQPPLGSHMPAADAFDELTPTSVRATHISSDVLTPTSGATTLMCLTSRPRAPLGMAGSARGDLSSERIQALPRASVDVRAALPQYDRHAGYEAQSMTGD